MISYTVRCLCNTNVKSGAIKILFSIINLEVELGRGRNKIVLNIISRDGTELRMISQLCLTFESAEFKNLASSPSQLY